MTILDGKIILSRIKLMSAGMDFTLNDMKMAMFTPATSYMVKGMARDF